MRPGILSSLLVCAFVAACGGQAASNAPATNRPQATAAVPVATAVPPEETDDDALPVTTGKGGTSIAHVEVGSGPLAGTYDATGEKLDCNLSSDASGATYQNLEFTDEFTGITIVVLDGGTAAPKISFQASFGPSILEQTYLEINTLDPSKPEGQATARLEDKGATIKWTVEGVTGEGVPIKASVECGPVDRR
jgi:hypothetical protein